MPPPACYCGRQGCVETWLSGPGLSADHKRHNGETLSPQVIEDRAKQANAACAATLARYDRRLARALAQVVNILDPDVIVLGGGLSNMARLYTNVPLLWSQYIFSDQVYTQLRRHQHGDSSGVRGAAWLWNGD
jgi:predicted NBD/HSP70 family sugar kinase